MARVPRKFTIRNNFSAHKVWRGHNREWNLRSVEHKRAYLNFLNADLESEKYESGCRLFGLTLMDSHSHELPHVIEVKAFSNHMRRHHSRYGAYFNRTMSRCGKVAQDRPYTELIGDSHHEMTTLFYIHANPVRAKMVKDARNYHWSTHRLYAYGKREPWMRNIELAPWYMRLGKNMAERQRRYRQLFNRYLEDAGLLKRPKRRFRGEGIWCLEQEAVVRAWRREHDPP